MEFDHRHAESSVRGSIAVWILLLDGDGCYHLMLSEDEWGIVEIVCSILWSKRCAVQPL